MKLPNYKSFLSQASLHFVGWVEPTPGSVGFRCTQPNLHFAGDILKDETQKRPILRPNPKISSKISLAALREEAVLTPET